MDLYSGLPYWIVKNALNDYYHPLEKDYSTDVVIIGSGITGALVAHELCKTGIKCCVIDKRTISTGSSCASTALLQYEIDVPLYKMSKMLGEQKAVMAYQCCLNAIEDIKKTFDNIGIDPDYKKVPSLFYASNKKGLDIIKKELDIRKKHHLPVSFLSSSELENKYGINAPAALENNRSAQVDAYLAAISLLNYNYQNNNLKIFSPTEIHSCNKKGNEYEIKTTAGLKIKSKYIVIAAGFESGKFLPEKVMKLTSTYALISQPVNPKLIWHGHSLIWETKEPYIYIRTTKNNRIIVGGEDEDFQDPVKRDELLRQKTAILERKFKKLFPKIPFTTDMAWCGTFSSTPDGLPYIGTWPGKDQMYFALGYGGNGITFSVNAAQMIANSLQGKQDERYAVFGFERNKNFH